MFSKSTSPFLSTFLSHNVGSFPVKYLLYHSPPSCSTLYMLLHSSSIHISLLHMKHSLITLLINMFVLSPQLRLSKVTPQPWLLWHISQFSWSRISLSLLPMVYIKCICCLMFLAWRLGWILPLSLPHNLIYQTSLSTSPYLAIHSSQWTTLNFTFLEMLQAL